ncbi:hypothetical protein TYRP_014879 [Tyrophagus putrescentiae]|nr:hypothetical protein TYRP_014879 [Tyrophagus putrescentiae]
MKFKHLNLLQLLAWLTTLVNNATTSPSSYFYSPNNYVEMRSLTEEDQSIPFHNFTTLPEALVGVEKYALSFNSSLNYPALLFAFSIKKKTIFKKAWGMADIENGLQANVNNTFRMLSLSKSFTAAVIGQLVDQGRLKYEDSVYQYVDSAHFSRKSFGGKAVDITIGQLLSHTAGIHATNGRLDFFTTIDPPDNVTEQIKRFKDQPLHRAPGTAFEYANNGFQVLGAVIESVTGKSYQSVMREFFAAHKLHGMKVQESSTMLHNIPRYYSGAEPKTLLRPMDARAKPTFPTTPFDEMIYLNGWWSAAGLVATLDDLLHYGHLLIDAYKGRPGAILKQETIKKMWSKHVSVGRQGAFTENSGYGYAWFVSTPPNQVSRTVIFHSGGIMGLTSQLTIFPEEEMVGVTFINKGVILEGEQMVLYAAANLYHLIK